MRLTIEELLWCICYLVNSAVVTLLAVGALAQVGADAAIAGSADACISVSLEPLAVVLAS